MVGENHSAETPAGVMWAGNAARETVIYLEGSNFDC